MNICLDYDTRVIPAALLAIEEEIHILQKQIAYLGSIVYFGLSFSTIFASYLFKILPARWIIVVMVMSNAAAWWHFAVSDNLYVLYLMRFIFGLTQAFVVIHAPVWTNEYSPPNASSRWLAMLHSAVVFGIIGGYILTSITVNYLSNYLSWRAPIYLQAVWQFVCAFIFMFFKREHIKNSKNQLGSTLIDLGIESNSGDRWSMNDKNTGLAYLCLSYRYLTRNSVFMFVTLALCSVYFVVSGIQFWTTAYFLTVLRMNPLLVLLFSLSVASLAHLLALALVAM